MPNIRGPWGVYEAQDGGLFLFTLVDDSAWHDFFAFADMPSAAHDGTWDSAAKRMGAVPTEQSDAAVDAIRAKVSEAFSRRTTSDWEAFFRSRDDVIVERVKNHVEVVNDKQVVDNGYVEPMLLPGAGNTRVVGNLVRLSKTPGSVKGPPPQLGAATADVLADLGFDETEISEVIAHADAVRREILGE